jgi:hypothetical protein
MQNSPTLQRLNHVMPPHLKPETLKPRVALKPYVPASLSQAKSG